jgi:OmcA/MtrC family decaheme c-type cytochrome
MKNGRFGKSSFLSHVLAAAIVSGIAAAPVVAQKGAYASHPKTSRRDAATVEFVRPGLVITIQSAQVASDGTISTTYTVADPQGLPLDALGVSTPGPIKLSFIAASIPKGQEQYTAYTTRTSTGAAVPSAVDAGPDAGGVTTTLGAGQYQYVFSTKAPAGFDATATHTIGIYGSRDLTIYTLPISYASTTFNFVPNGSPVITTRDVVKTASCNTCHDQLSHHGGSRRGVEMCVLCHTPQSVDASTGNTVDFKVMVHKIHMGSQLPSVIAGKPYQFGSGTGLSDFSTVIDPADPRRCQTCHSLTSGAAQATAFLTKPTMQACGACHDDVNFASGVNHPGGPQIDNNMCATCHIPQGELEFDASILGAHVVPVDSTMLSGLVVSLVSVAKATAGSQPVVTFTVQNKAGAGVLASALGSLSLTMAGPTTDYGYTSFGADVTTKGYVTESAIAAPCSANGTCVYTFQHAVPASATGTYTIGIESRRTETLLPNTTKQMAVTYGAINKVLSFSVDGSPLLIRRTVVATTSCNQCHVSLSEHGSLRNQTEYCVLCHNPSDSDFSTRPTAVVAADRLLPPQGINFNLLVHRIHSGPNVVADGGKPFVVVGFGGSHNDFSGILFPALTPQGNPLDLAQCSLCHVNGSEQNLPFGLNAVVDPQGPINPDQPITAACTGCHTSIVTASHALANTSVLGESCQTCHAAGAAFAVAQVHTQY